jgi:hypothetical protein
MKGGIRNGSKDAYFYAYPIVSMDATMRQATNVPDASSVNMRAPVNQFAHVRKYPKADEKDVVRFNFDTLYSFAWLDLSKEPIILSVPDTQGRYYLLPMLDMWTDVLPSSAAAPPAPRQAATRSCRPAGPASCRTALPRS